MSSPYRLPEGNVQISLSGGRTSAYMLHEIARENGGIDAERVAVVFGNTGREMPETLDFIAEIGARWGIAIHWVEFTREAPFFSEVSHNSAARNGEPFEELIRKKKYLPNQQARFCTADLKVIPSKRLLLSMGWTHWEAALGIRADEPKRIHREPQKERWQRWYPLADAGVTKRDVQAFWDAQPFDLRLPNINGSCPLGNCDGCFLKSEANLAALVRDFPERGAWWQEMEALASDLTSNPSGETFSKRYSRKELASSVERQGDWLFNTEGALCQADGGDCTE